MDTQKRGGEQQPAPDHTPAGRPRMGDEMRQSVRLTLPRSEVERLREIGYGSASMGVSLLLRWWEDQGSA